MEIKVLAEDRHKLRFVVNRLTDDRVTKNAGKFLTIWMTVKVWRRALFSGRGITDFLQLLGSVCSTVYRVHFPSVFSWRHFRPVASDSVAAIRGRLSTWLASNRNKQCDSKHASILREASVSAVRGQGELESILALYPCAPHGGISGSWSMAPLIRNFGNRWGSVASFTSGLLYNPDLTWMPWKR